MRMGGMQLGLSGNYEFGRDHQAYGDSVRVAVPLN